MKMYRAVIEDNNNTNQDGRVKVRIIGIHTRNNENGKDDFNLIKTEDLPWAEVVGSLDNSLNSGIGLSSVPKQGTMVWVILENDDVNYPIVIGTINGVSTVDSTGLYAGGEGFCDPDEVYPIVERLNEPDINRLARVDKLDQTIHQDIIDNKSSAVNGPGTTQVAQTEPDSLNNLSVYPNVQVKETASGHVVEFDDTPTNERVRVYHKSGSYIEIRPDGSFIQKSVGAENHYIHSGDVQAMIDGAVKKYIGSTLDMRVVELMTLDVDGKLLINGDVKVVGGGIEVTGKVSAASGVTSGAEVADSTGNLSSLRNAYDGHNHMQNAGDHFGGGVPTAIPTTTDPVVRDTDFSAGIN